MNYISPIIKSVIYRPRTFLQCFRYLWREVVVGWGVEEEEEEEGVSLRQYSPTYY